MKNLIKIESAFFLIKYRKIRKKGVLEGSEHRKNSVIKNIYVQK